MSRGPAQCGPSVLVHRYAMDRALSKFAMDRALIERMASLARAVVPTWRSVTAAALLSMLLCVALTGTAHATPAPDGLNPPTVVMEEASSITQTTATLNATVNPNEEEVTSCKFEYGTTELYGSSVPCSSLPGSGAEPVAVSASLENLSPNTTYYFRIVATNSEGTSEGTDQTFKTLPNAPTVSGVSPDKGPEAGATSVTITGTDLSEAAAVEFGSVSAASFEATSPTSITAIAPAGTDTVDVSVTTSGGTSATGPADRFSYVPAPAVVTKAASSIAQTTATLNATVNPNGGEVSSCEFEYGTTEFYGSSMPCSTLPGSGAEPVAVSASLTGLIKNTTYHFRVVATNTGGTSPGVDQAFETAPGPPTVIAGEPSSIGQTLVMLNAEINPNGGEVTQCYFHYEKVTSGAQVFITPCVGLPLSGKSPVKVSALAEGLSASTRYNFSLEVINSFGEGAFGEGSEPFKTLPGPSVVTEKASSITQTSATLNATVNPNGGEVSNCHFEYGTTESYGSSATCMPSPGAGASPVAVSAQVHGLSVNTPYYFRIVATNPGGESKDTLGQKFTTLPNPPVVVTAVASSPTQTSATLNGTVNPNGGTVSDCRFEYGASTSYGSSVSCLSLPGSGEGPVAVSAALEGLSANTTYHFRVVATNAGGPGLPGADQTFTTPPNAPTVGTEKASSITQTTATLNATVDPNGGTVSDCKLEYGSSTSYGSSVPCTPSPGSGNSAVAVSASLGSLSASTTYHFRVVATNPGGAHSGSDQSFTTAPVPVPPATKTTETPLATTMTKTETTTTATATATTTTTPSTTSVTPVATCRVSLASTSVIAQTGDMAAIELVWTGTGADTCSGKLTLTVKTKGKGGRPKPTLIGTGAFSIPFGEDQIVKVRLNKAGRALLNAGHGRLSASLAILELFPDPSPEQTETIHLVPAAHSSSRHEK